MYQTEPEPISGSVIFENCIAYTNEEGMREKSIPKQHLKRYQSGDDQHKLINSYKSHGRFDNGTQ